MSIFAGMGQIVYVQVLLPLKLEWTPWYSTEEELRVGQRVEVIFARKSQIGVVVRIRDHPEIDPAKVERIQSADTGLPDISENELRLWEFVSGYYLCTPGEVLKAAYPNSKLRGEKIGVLIDRKAALSRARMEAALQRKVDTLSQRLLAKEEQLQSRKSSGKRAKAEVTERLQSERDSLASQFDNARAALASFLTDSDLHKGGAVVGGGAERYPAPGGKPLLIRGANRMQEYFRHCEACLAAGRDVLVLEPESELGLNIENEFSRRFCASPADGKLLIYNAQTSPAQKRRIASQLRGAHEPVIVLGQRSAIFLPYSSLGLIIVDEEQDSSYKQTEPAPRYNGRDLAAVLASISGAGFILGSNCPSLETLLNALSGKYALMDLPEAHPAKVEIIDINDERRKNGMVGDFSRKAIEAVNKTAPDALITIVRCFRSEEQTAEQLHGLFPGRDPQILTAYAARKSPVISDLTIIMQADALFDRDDFRADEKVLQLLTMLKSRTRELIVQTGAGRHPVFAALAGTSCEDALLAERKQFSLPPFTRIVDVHDLRGGQLIERVMLPRDRNLAGAKEELRSRYRGVCSPGVWFDVDPL